MARWKDVLDLSIPRSAVFRGLPAIDQVRPPRLPPDGWHDTGYLFDLPEGWLEHVTTALPWTSPGWPRPTLMRVVRWYWTTSTPTSSARSTGRAKRRIAPTVEFHYTPTHGSWLNMAEIE